MNTIVTDERISLTSRGGKSSEGVAKKEFLSVKTRISKAALRGILLVGMTIIGSLIPLLHLFVFFGGFILTIFVVLTTYKTTTMLNSAQGVCPECSAPFRILKRSWKFPFTDPCEQCHREIVISLLN